MLYNKAWKNRLWIAAAASALAAAAAACSSQPQVILNSDGQPLPPASAQLTVSPNSPVADVPMPSGFMVLESKSRTYLPGSGGRLIDHAYQGIASRTDVITFYRYSLAENHWVKQSESSKHGKFQSTFTKGRENLDLTIAGDDVVTTVHLHIESHVESSPR